MSTLLSLCLLLVAVSAAPWSRSPSFPPRFLMRVPRVGRADFYDILSNDQLSIDEQNRQLEKWSEKYDVEIYFDQWAHEMHQKREMMTQRVQQVVAKLPTVFEKLQEILKSTNISQREQYEKINQLGQQYPLEMRTLFGVAAPRHPPMPHPMPMEPAVKDLRLPVPLPKLTLPIQPVDEEETSSESPKLDENDIIIVRPPGPHRPYDPRTDILLGSLDDEPSGFEKLSRSRGFRNRGAATRMRFDQFSRGYTNFRPIF